MSDGPNDMARLEREAETAACHAPPSPTPPPAEIFDVAANSDAQTRARILAAAENDETLLILANGLYAVARALVVGAAGAGGGPAGPVVGVAADLVREVAEGAIRRAAARR